MSKKILTLILLAPLSGGVLAHSGNTDYRGCHTDHARGYYHCHSGHLESTPKADERDYERDRPRRRGLYDDLYDGLYD